MLFECESSCRHSGIELGSKTHMYLFKINNTWVALEPTSTTQAYIMISPEESKFITAMKNAGVDVHLFMRKDMRH